MPSLCNFGTTTCNDWSLQAPLTQRLFLARALCAIANSGDLRSCDDADIADAATASGELCINDPNLIRLRMMQALVDSGYISTTPTTCLTPVQIEAAIAYFLCTLITAAGGPQ